MKWRVFKAEAVAKLNGGKAWIAYKDLTPDAQQVVSCTTWAEAFAVAQSRAAETAA